MLSGLFTSTVSVFFSKVQVHATLTQDNSKLFMKLHQIKPRGFSQFVTAVRIAHLGLKHRQNRNHKPRIVVFVGSPMAETKEAVCLNAFRRMPTFFLLFKKWRFLVGPIGEEVEEGEGLRGHRLFRRVGHGQCG